MNEIELSDDIFCAPRGNNYQQVNKQDVIHFLHEHWAHTHFWCIARFNIQGHYQDFAPFSVSSSQHALHIICALHSLNPANMVAIPVSTFKPLLSPQWGNNCVGLSQILHWIPLKLWFTTPEDCNEQKWVNSRQKSMETVVDLLHHPRRANLLALMTYSIMSVAQTYSSGFSF